VSRAYADDSIFSHVFKFAAAACSRVSAIVHRPHAITIARSTEACKPRFYRVIHSATFGVHATSASAHHGRGNCKLRGFGMSDTDLQAELERLRAENESLKAGRTKGAISLKVSEKGAVSLYGLGRFPVTLYKEQWARLLDQADQIREFISENESKLKAKE
jgi:hypothetical protein